MPQKDPLGERLKEYEGRETSRSFLPYIPVYARIDGRGFSKFTKNAVRPFDPIISAAMVAAASRLVADTGAEISYTQSDEISLVWITRQPGEEMFFKGKVQKMTSVLASLATAAFIESLLKSDYASWVEKLPHFDARVIQLPSRVEAANMFLWRESDARKNAISMAAHSVFSHKSLQGLSGVDKLAKMANESDIDFESFPVAFRRGSFMRRVTRTTAMPEDMRMAIPEKNRPAAGTEITRSAVEVLDMPPFNTVTNRTEVIFDAADPIV